MQNNRIKLINKQQRGSVSVLIAFMLPVLIGVAAFAIDLGFKAVTKSELQNAADAAALAGAGTLYRDGTLNWSDAIKAAQDAIKLNSAAGRQLRTGTVTGGYWNPSSSSPTFQVSPISLSPGDSPVISVAISKSEGENDGGSTVFFAKYWGINSLNVSASAIAGRTSPSTIPKGYLFPLIITQCLYTKYWNTASIPPSPIIKPGTNEPERFQLSSAQKYSGCNGGNWSSLDDVKGGTNVIRSLLDTLNTKPLSIGDDAYVRPGVSNDLFDDVNACSAAGNKKCEYVLAPVVANDYNPNGPNTILAFACLRITMAINSSKDKYIEVQMSNRCQPTPGTGIGPGYGVNSYPHLFN